MLHDILIWGYIVLSIAGFCYAVGCIRGIFRVGLNRKEGVNPILAVTAGLANADHLTPKGKDYRQNFIHSFTMGLVCALGLVAIVIVGIFTQSTPSV